MITNQEQIAAWDQDWAKRFPKRLTRKQKEVFRNELEITLQDMGYETVEIKGRRLLHCTNLVTQCDQPKLIFLAHYDTPTIIPFWFSWLFDLFGHTRQTLAAIVMLIFLIAPSFATFWFPQLASFVSFFQLLLVLSFISLFIPNPHNREDNTSGVIGLLALADWLKDKPALRARVQFAFIDNEEWGLLGSGVLKRYWKQKSHPFQDAKIINLDCIARGQKTLLIYHKNSTLASALLPYLQNHMPEAEMKNMGMTPLSDNYTFRNSGAVDISFFDKTTIPGGYVIKKIHTPADNDFSLDRLPPLLTGLTEFIENEVKNTI